MGTQRGKLICLLLALVLIAGACGGSDDAETASETSSGADETTSGAPESGGEQAESDESLTLTDDAEADFDAAGSEDAAGEMMEESDDAMEEEAASAPAASSAPTDRAAAPEGGFFAPDDRPDDEVDDTANFVDYGVRPFVDTERDPLSTFALDVDTAAYSVARRWLTEGSMPPPESVRVEEFVNSFDYDYDAPADGLAVQVDAGPSPFDPENVILRVGVQAERVGNAERPDASLTFVVDTSGSMDRVDRLGLVKTSLSRLVAELSDDDTVAIVTYADGASVVLEPTPADRREQILSAIDRLEPTGSTNLEAGLVQGYELATESFLDRGINRVVLASDGIANVGLTDPEGLAGMIRDDADRGIQLVTVGVGMGGFNDEVMEQLANRGDGFYAYVDDLGEAERLFGDELVSTLLTVAKDGKIQVEFDAESVSRYRLIGFENRGVLDDDFRDDSVDAGELGAGHQVTALYELTLRPGVASDDDRRLGTVRLRWENDDRSVDETNVPVDAGVVESSWDGTADDFRLAVTVAAWAELLRQSPHTGEVTLAQVQAEAEALSPGSGAVAELVDLIELSR
ncbi:MAG: von Willebrand factor type A domain-containing protein [Actinomycetota bacterium]